jgi:hypothetical protein
MQDLDLDGVVLAATDLLEQELVAREVAVREIELDLCWLTVSSLSRPSHTKYKHKPVSEWQRDHLTPPALSSPT